MEIKQISVDDATSLLKHALGFSVSEDVDFYADYIAKTKISDELTARYQLLRQEANGYSFVANIMDASDAADLNVDALEQADISVARDGSIIMLVTPIILGADPSHQGCMVFEFDDFTTGQLKRDTNGVAIPRTIITSDGNGLGPGLCSYDAMSDTGVLLVITSFTQNNTDIEFSLRATGVHP